MKTNKLITDPRLPQREDCVSHYVFSGEDSIISLSELDSLISNFVNKYKLDRSFFALQLNTGEDYSSYPILNLVLNFPETQEQYNERLKDYLNNLEIERQNKEKRKIKRERKQYERLKKKYEGSNVL